VVKPKKIFAWPPVIASCEPCFQLVCPRCGDFNVPYSYVLTVRDCPSCRRKDVDVRSLGHAHHWAMMVQRLAIDNRPDKILRQSMGIAKEHKIALHNIIGPFDDEESAVTALSARMGFLLPRASA
jgi:hypothetical protein